MSAPEFNLFGIQTTTGTATPLLIIEALAPEWVAHLQRLGRATVGQQTELCIAAEPRDIMLVVVGGVGAKSTYIPIWGGTTRVVTRAIALSEDARYNEKAREPC